MTRLRRSGWCLVSFALVLAIFCAADAGEIKIALDCPPDLNKCGTYVFSKAFSDHLIASGLAVKLYPDQALGNEDEKLDQVSQGLLEISNSFLGKTGQLDPTVFGFNLYYLFDSLEHADKVIANTDVLNKINAGLTKKGVRLLALASVGSFSGFANTKRPIKTPADMKGLRMRAMDKVQTEYLSAWGASTVVVEWAEIYNALQTGVTDGYINPAIVPVMFKHTELLKYYSDVKVGVPFRVIICSERWYKGLSDKDRKIVDEATVKGVAANREWQTRMEKSDLDTLKAAGVQVYQNTVEEREQFANIARPLYAKVTSPEIAEMFIKAAEKNR
ncbi:MAG: TRAP transporter substrate-binding protein [Deltaproteobacteria bacterium]|nr:TRAP transporter substrate-binding protein [Deltaproteobacteria bacterium]